MKIKIGLIGDFNSDVTAHNAIPLALKLSGEKHKCLVEYEWMNTELIFQKYLNKSRIHSMDYGQCPLPHIKY